MFTDHEFTENQIKKYLASAARDFKIAGDDMRKKRNYDLYGGGVLISEKEALEYRQWLKNIFLKAENYLFGTDRLYGREEEVKIKTKKIKIVPAWRWLLS